MGSSLPVPCQLLERVFAPPTAALAGDQQLSPRPNHDPVPIISNIEPTCPLIATFCFHQCSPIISDRSFCFGAFVSRPEHRALPNPPLPSMPTFLQVSPVASHAGWMFSMLYWWWISPPKSQLCILQSRVSLCRPSPYHDAIWGTTTILPSFRPCSFRLDGHAYY